MENVRWRNQNKISLVHTLDVFLLWFSGESVKVDKTFQPLLSTIAKYLVSNKIYLADPNHKIPPKKTKEENFSIKTYVSTT